MPSYLNTSICRYYPLWYSRFGLVYWTNPPGLHSADATVSSHVHQMPQISPYHGYQASVAFLHQYQRGQLLPRAAAGFFQGGCKKARQDLTYEFIQNRCSGSLSKMVDKTILMIIVWRRTIWGWILDKTACQEFWNDGLRLYSINY
ncbi:uncharacterized protein LOC121864380 [Homarus americanus]|uniref:uncharacterized protein LOC121864380 n=1 Tax=Homarus americanus TaxID=6706 RepID=UPI001C454230|nr:uncharacterized protein LOC121864380 [Homarus americanus]